MSREGIMSTRKTVWIVLAVALMALTAAVALTACGGDASSDSSASPGAGETKTLPIGVLMPFSGDGALWGKTELASTEVAAEHINAAGGIKVGNDTYMLEVKAYDNEWDPAVSATVARKAVADGVRYVLSWSGPEVLAENAATRGTTVLTFVTASDEMCQGPDHPNNYNSWFYFPDNMGVLYTYIHEARPEYTTVAMVATDDAVSLQEAKSLKEQIEPIGFEVLPPVKISGEETDFYPVLTPVVNKGVDIIDIAPMGPEDAALLIKQARELGFEGIFAHADAPNIDEYADVAGWDAIEGLVGCPVYLELSDVGKKWQTDYQAKTDGDMSTGPTADYDSVLLLAAAIEKAGSVDPDVVNEALPTVTVEGTTGETRFGGQDVLGIPHLLERPIQVVEVQNGKLVSVFSGWPPRLAGAEESSGE
jgi:branched-chain amino acid transport system substrate-binding protein